MAIPVLLILAVLWAAVLVPPLFKARTVRRHGDSIGDFTNSLDVIGRTGGFQPSRPAPIAPAQLAAPPRGTRGGRVPVAGRGHGPARIGAVPVAAVPVMTPAQRRRRDVLIGLFAGVVVTLLGAVLVGSRTVWMLQLFVDALLVTYLVLLVRMRTLATEQAVKVRYLPQAPPQLALRRTASS